jgi:hypothetical protein
MLSQSLIDKPIELLELINKSLKPKKTEKDKFGEVFTPMTMVNEMLDAFDSHYKEKHNNKSVFTEKNKTWFESSKWNGKLSNFYLHETHGWVER